MNLYLAGFLVSLAINAVFFAVAVSRKTDVFTDLSYSLSFAAGAVLLAVLAAPLPWTKLLAVALVVLWALRLGGYLFGRIISIKVDHRFDEMRDRPLRFARFWILQALTVAVVLLPLTALLASDGNPAFGAFQALGLVLWTLGFLIEALADAQKSAFKKTNPGGFVTTGLWRLSRHPNYFGEILLWWALLIYALPWLAGGAFASILGPLFITLLLLFVSGIPLLEKSAEAKHGEDPAYVAYRDSTSLLIPLPPRRRAAGGEAS